MSKHSEQSPMKLSEAIRLGAMLGPQAFGHTFAGAATCAQGAAARAIGAPITFAIELREFWPQFPYETRFHMPCDCSWIAANGGLPMFGEAQALGHLNDAHHWTREAIADWVETIEQAQSSALVPRSAENIMEKEVEEFAMVNK